MGERRSDEKALWIWLLTDIYIPSILAAIARGALATAIPLYMISREAPPLQVGLGAASISLGNLVADLPGGFLLRARGEVFLMRISLLVASAASLGMWILQSPQLVPILATAFGGGRGLWLLSRRYVITYYLGYGVRGRASSFIGASERIGAFVGPAIVAVLVEGPGYGGVFLAAFALTACSSALSMVSRRAAPKPMAGPAHGDSADEGEGEIRGVEVGRKALALLVTAQIAMQGVRSSRTILVPLMGKDVLGLGDAAVSLAMSLSGALDVLGAYPSGIIMDRSGRHRSVMISFSLMALGFLLLAAARDPLAFLTAAAVIGLGNGFGSGVLITLGGDMGSIMRRGPGALFLAFWQFAGDLGSAAFPMALGAASEALGRPALSAAVSTVSASIAASAGRILRIRRPS